MNFEAYLPAGMTPEDLLIIMSALSAGSVSIAVWVALLHRDPAAKRAKKMALQRAEMRAGFPRVRVLSHDRRSGQSTAIRSGVIAARAPWIVTLDGDGQNDPADIPALMGVIRAAGRPADLQLVGGNRRVRRDSWTKRMASRVANGVRSRFLSDGTPDTGCGLKVFSRQAFLQLPYFDHLHRFLAAMFIRDGWTVTSIDVRHRHREHGTTKYGVLDRLWIGVVDMLGVKWLSRRRPDRYLCEILGSLRCEESDCAVFRIAGAARGLH